MIQTVALTILMPVILPTTPVRLPGPSTPVSIEQSIRLPGPVLPVAIGKIEVRVPGTVAPKLSPSAIDTLRKLVKDDRPLVVKAGFDGVTLPESDLETEIGVPAVRVGRAGR